MLLSFNTLLIIILGYFLILIISRKFNENNQNNKKEIENERIKQEKINKLKQIKKEAKLLEKEINYTNTSDSEENEMNINTSIHSNKYYEVDPDYKEIATLDFEEVNL